MRVIFAYLILLPLMLAFMVLLRLFVPRFGKLPEDKNQSIDQDFAKLQQRIESVGGWRARHFGSALLHLQRLAVWTMGRDICAMRPSAVLGE